MRRTHTHTTRRLTLQPARRELDRGRLITAGLALIAALYALSLRAAEQPQPIRSAQPLVPRIKIVYVVATATTMPVLPTPELANVVASVEPEPATPEPAAEAYQVSNAPAVEQPA